MFKDLQRLFQQSMAAFRAELDRREPEDQVAELLTAMRREMAAARAALPELEQEGKRAAAELERETELLRQCERRGALAERIGDEETVRVAAEFAARHRERIVVLEQRRAAADAEHALRLREAEEMRRKYLEADANRFALVAQLRRTRSQQEMRSRLDGTSGPFADFARMEEAVQQSAGYADALEELSDAAPPPRPPPAPDVEERLRELKRRMGSE
jgi:phage shock protein A